MKVIITGKDLTLEQVRAVAREGATVELSAEAKDNINRSRKVVDDIIAQKKVVYGVTTGFGSFCNTVIKTEESKLLQKNLIVTHAVGAGDPFPTEVSKTIMLLRVNNLAKGFSGVRMETVETLVAMINKGVTPVIPEKGSLGASGDLAPLSHMVLPMLGLGIAEYNGEVMSGEEAMKKAGIPTIELTEKEGLALINGTQAMNAVGALTMIDTLELVKVADVAAALSFEAQNGVYDALQPRMHTVRPHQGQMDSAAIINHLLEGSKNTTKQGEIKVQDAYSLRCAPQIHGASKDAINYVKEQIEIEMNSVTDNPIIFADTMEGISGGNFHGQPMALSFDFLGIALSELANVSERRLERLVNPALSGLPAFLVENGGLNSGFMIVQYSAAALVSENKVLAHPASVDSIPSSANQEDHVSMGTIAARKANSIMKNVRRVLAMELMCACQAIDLRGDKGLGLGTKPAYEVIRKVCPKLEDDRPLYEDINNCENTIISGDLLSAVEGKAGEIKF
ncbi:MAG: histidine ammonia-lyase [Lachnospiraceae bacterium]|jgi:histidine ammonia-lyase|nr:histidine ammonia-lyase [Lachnospiraceae bacterium]